MVYIENHDFNNVLPKSQNNKIIFVLGFQIAPHFSTITSIYIRVIAWLNVSLIFFNPEPVWATISTTLCTLFPLAAMNTINARPYRRESFRSKCKEVHTQIKEFETKLFAKSQLLFKRYDAWLGWHDLQSW